MGKCVGVAREGGTIWENEEAEGGSQGGWDPPNYGREEDGWPCECRDHTAGCVL